MNADTVKIELAALRDGDAAIADALAAVQTKQDLWLSAMRAGQAAILAGLTPADAAGKPVETARPNSKPRPPATPVQGLGTDSPRPPVTPEDDLHESVPVSAQPDREPEPSAPGDRDSGMFWTVTSAAGVEPDQPPPAGDAEADEPPGPEDDEALLAGLDEETAKLIRVKQRLSGGRQSVRELLKQVRTEHKPKLDQPQQRNRWWRRSNEQ